MKREEYKINIGYAYKPEHKGAPYTLDGEKFINGGEFAEIVTKAVLGYTAEKDANTPFDKGSDIEELCASIKSSKATLTSAILGNDYDTIKHVYFQRVHSTTWIYTVIIEDTAILYRMNKKEFAVFMDNFGYYAKERQTIRFKATSGKMIAWLDRAVALSGQAMPCHGTGHGGYDGGYATCRS